MNTPKDPPSPSQKVIELSFHDSLHTPTKPQPTPLDTATTTTAPTTPTTMDNLVSPIDSASGDDSEAFGVFGARAVDQAELEREVATKADQAMLEGANEDDQRRLDKTVTEKAKIDYMLSVAEERYFLPQTTKLNKTSLEIQIKELKEKLTQLNGDIKDITSRMAAREAQAMALLSQQKTKKSVSDHRLPNESDREFLIRTGKITPFDNIPGLGQPGASQEDAADELPHNVLSAQNLRRPGFAAAMDRTKPVHVSSSGLSSAESSNPEEDDREEDDEEAENGDVGRGTKRRKVTDDDDDDYTPDGKEKKTTRRKVVRKSAVRDTETESSEEEDSDDEHTVVGRRKRKKSPGNAAGKAKAVRLDDGDEKLFQKRIHEWVESRRSTREHDNGADAEDDKREEWNKPHPTIPDEGFSSGVEALRLPGDIHASLFSYQKVAVQWFWELHCQNVGGILGDEMGTGKTIQMIAFLAGLHYSGLLDKPIIVVAPGAVLGQWASEFHVWWPAMRVAILHKSGSGMLLSRDGEIDSDDDKPPKPSKVAKFAAKKIVDRVFKHGHVLITTYEGLNTYGDLLVEKEWGYAVLDEGHRIRNPDARVSLNCKQLKTQHRIILSGTPIQNNLVELWSLFDFVFPGRLGTLPVFKEQFEVPIRLGGFKNANNVQVQTATSCATVLRDLIGPYLLRRMKTDVAKDLPPKEEKVLFCKLTKGQQNMYLEYLRSPEVIAILNGKRESFSGISVLRKICCHPDLAANEQKFHTEQEYGRDIYSGKMQVMKKMLFHWREQGHRVLLFSQSVQVLNIIQKNLDSYKDFKYSRMDGGTPIDRRQQLVNEFNTDTSIDVFLLTTRVGGLGLNLTGADRVIIFDPDWNPSTDLQARERSWRIGQTKPVHVFRLIAAGTIEEKMYNRQLFKQHLSQKVLNNPEQRRFFEMENIRDLFTYGKTGGGTSTGAMFQGAETVNSKSSASAEDSALQGINGVAGLEKYAINDQSAEGSGERKFIEEIFSHNGVISSLEHDHVVNAGINDRTPTDAYARKIAEEAAKRLQESVAATSGAAVGTVTWTGRNGSAGRDPPRATASGLLQTMKGQQGRATPTGRRAGPVVPLRTQMLGLFEKNAGKLPTGELKKWCRDVGIDNRAPEKAKEMRAILKDIARLDKETHVWSLKK